MFTSQDFQDTYHWRNYERFGCVSAKWVEVLAIAKIATSNMEAKRFMCAKANVKLLAKLQEN